MVNLHRRYRITTAQLAAATEERYSDGSGSGSITMPHEEVRDYFYQRQNYLHELDTAAEDLTIQMRLHHGDLARELNRRLTEVHGVHINRRIDLGDTVLHRYDPGTKTLEISNHLSLGQQVFKMAAELAYLEYGDLIDSLVAEGKFTSDESHRLARLGLANYFAAAAVLPYRQFHDVSENFRYDVERLSSFYSVSYETIAHRLSTLQRPSMRGVPFSFVRVDRAGNMSKRQSATGFHFSSSGGTCPLWNVYETFANPGKILVQIAQMPDGRNYMWVARTVERRAARYGQPGKTFAIGLGCELRHAHRLVYSEGLDLSGEHRHTDRRGLPGLRTRQLPAAGVPGPGPRAGSGRAPQHGLPVLGEATVTGARNGRIPSGRFRELGPINWVLAKLAARTVRAPEMHLFTTLGQHRLLFLAWSIYSGRVLRGRLPAIDTELVILRVAHVRACEYELQHHRRMAAKQGLNADLQAAIFAWPERQDRVEARLTRAAAGVAHGDGRVHQGPHHHRRHLAAARRAPRPAPADRILLAGKPIRWAGSDDGGTGHPAGQPPLARSGHR